MSEIEELTNRINELESKIVELELKKSKNKLTTVLEPATCSICGKTLRNKYILKTARPLLIVAHAPRRYWTVLYVQ